MWSNFIKVTFRSFWKQKLMSSINILSLSIGIACAALAYVFIQHEISFDQFHDDYKNIFWLHGSINNSFNLPSTPGALGPALKENFMEVTEVFRMHEGEAVLATKNEFFQEKLLFVDPNFFEFFNFSLELGNPNKVLDQLNSIVLSPSMAQKYFGRQNPIGESIRLFYQGEENSFQVTGVATGAPTNSSIQFDFLLPLSFAHKDDPVDLNNDWSSFPTGTFIRLRDGEDLPQFNSQLPAFVDTQYPDKQPGEIKFLIQAFEDYHLGANGSMHAEGLTLRTNPNYVRMLSIIAILILVVACLNFTNLSNARGTQRLVEVGVRQVLGASRYKLISQFLTESVIFSFLSLVLATLLMQIPLHYITQLFDYPITIDWWSPMILLPVFGIVLLTGILAGIYPAFLLSKSDLKAKFKSIYRIGRNNWITKVGLVFQFCLSIGLLICTIVMNQQQQFLSHKDLGFNQEQVLVIPTQIQYRDSTNTDQLLAQYRSELSKYPAITQVAGVSFSFSRGNMGRMISEDGTFDDFVFEYKIDSNYLNLLGIELIAGRNLSDRVSDQSGKSIIVNETFLSRFEIDQLDAFRLPGDFGELSGASIVGVVKDYNFLDLKQSINPMLLSMSPDQRFHHILVKVQPEDIPKTITQLKSSWQVVRPDKPFQFSFLDEDLQQQYVSESRWGKVISAATVLAMLIAFLGLFGLVALSLAERTKEIGIRKVLGASIATIITSFSKDFLLLVFISTLIVSPLAWYAMQQWLKDFVFHIDIQWWVFTIAGLSVMAITLLTVSLQSLRAALTNPVEALKDE